MKQILSAQDRLASTRQPTGFFLIKNLPEPFSRFFFLIFYNFRELLIVVAI